MSKLKALLLTQGMHGMVSQVEGLAKALNLNYKHQEIKLKNYDKNQITKDNKELLDYFNNNSASYMTNEERDISYILINKSDFRENFSPSENSLNEYYNNNKNLNMIKEISFKNCLKSFEGYPITLLLSEISLITPLPPPI